MSNPYLPPSSPAKKPSKDNFHSAYKSLQFAIRSGILLLTLGLVSAALADQYNLDRVNFIAMGVAGFGILTIALAFLMILPLTVWGFRSGLNAAKKKPDNRNT